MAINKKNLVGIDISHHNPGSFFNMDCWDFTIHKISEGTSYTDSGWKNYVTAIKDAHGVLAGGYHYIRLSNVKRQAELIVKNIKPVAGKILLVIDFEDVELQNVNGVRVLRDLINELHKYMPNYIPIVYTNKYIFKKIIPQDIKKEYSWWIADYKSDTREDTIYDDTTILMKQWTNCGGMLDINIFYGTSAGWWAFAESTESAADEKAMAYTE